MIFGKPRVKSNPLSRRGVLVCAVVFVFSAGAASSVFFDRILHPPVVKAQEIRDVPDSVREAWSMIHDFYVDPEALNDRKITDLTIAGMLQAVGDEGHTRYIPREELMRFQTDTTGEYVGIGIQIEERNNRFVIQVPLEASPAKRAGLESGDILVRINDRQTQGQSLPNLIQQFRGREGSCIKLTCQRPGKSGPFDVTLKRTRVKLNPVSWTLLPGNIAQIRLSQFSWGAGDQVGSAIRKAEKAGATGIIFDLRDNPGGLVEEAVNVASHFLPANAPVFTSQFQNKHKVVHYSYHSNTRTSLPIEILVNRGTASAAEIVAAAVHDEGRGRIIGERTFGTGTLTHEFGLSNGGALLIGTELWLAPSGKPIRGQGISPDFTIAAPPGHEYVPGSAAADQTDIRNDPQLLGAMKLMG